MKKTILGLILGILLVGIILPSAIFAQEGVPTGCTMRKDVGITGCPTSGVCSYSNSTCGICCLMNTVYTVTDWIFIALMVISVIMIILGGFNFVTSGGNPDKTTAGRNYIMYAAIGIAIGLLAKAVPAVVKMVVGA